ncbi:hypothetical protein ACWDNT_27660, partial [Streptomyces sp. NPDC000963]
MIVRGPRPDPVPVAAPAAWRSRWVTSSRKAPRWCRVGSAAEPFTGAEGIKTAAQAAKFGGQAGVAYDVNYHA